jgi:hypothetical protein
MGGSVSIPPVINSQHMAAQHLWEELKKDYDIKENRERQNVRVRQAFAVALTNETGLTYSAIGNIMNKNHATIIHCRRNHESNMLYDPHYPEIYDLMCRKIYDMIISGSDETRAILNRKYYFSEKNVENYFVAIEKKYKRKLEHVVNENVALKKLVKDLTKRNEKLNDICVRLKNLA